MLSVIWENICLPMWYKERKESSEYDITRKLLSLSLVLFFKICHSRLLSFLSFLSPSCLLTLWDRKRTQWATWRLIRTKRDSFWVGRLKWSHCWSQMVSFWMALWKLLPLGAKLVSFWMAWNRRVSNRLTWSQLVLFWVAYRKAPPQRAKMASFWVVWFPCG